MKVFSDQNKSSDFLSKTEPLVEFNSLIWKTKKEQGLSLKSEIEGITIPPILIDFKDALISMHNLL